MKYFLLTGLLIALFAFTPSDLYAGPCDQAQDGGPQGGPYPAGKGPGAGTSSIAGEKTSENTMFMLLIPWRSIVDVTCAGFAALGTLLNRGHGDQASVDRANREYRERILRLQDLRNRLRELYARSTSGGANVNGPEEAGNAARENAEIGATVTNVVAQAADKVNFAKDHTSQTPKNLKDMIKACPECMGSDFPQVVEKLKPGGSGKILASELVSALGSLKATPIQGGGGGDDLKGCAFYFNKVENYQGGNIPADGKDKGWSCVFLHTAVEMENRPETNDFFVAMGFSKVGPTLPNGDYYVASNWVADPVKRGHMIAEWNARLKARLVDAKGNLLATPIQGGVSREQAAQWNWELVKIRAANAKKIERVSKRAGSLTSRTSKCNAQQAVDKGVKKTGLPGITGTAKCMSNKLIQGQLRMAMAALGQRAAAGQSGLDQQSAKARDAESRMVSNMEGLESIEDCCDVDSTGSGGGSQRVVSAGPNPEFIAMIFSREFWAMPENPPGKTFADQLNRDFAIAFAELDARTPPSMMAAWEEKYDRPETQLANAGAYTAKPVEKISNVMEGTVNLSNMSLKDFISTASRINIQDQLTLQPASATVTVQPTLEEMLALAKDREKSL